MTNHTYFIKGMHCASCELIIEKKLLELSNVKVADASIGNQTVTIDYEGGQPSVVEINKIFKENGYTFSDRPFEIVKNSFGVLPIVIATVLVGIFLLLSKLGIASVVNVNGSSSVPAFFIFGLVAGLSSCAALVGGLILSLSKQWQANYADSDSLLYRSTPHLMFNIGRVLSYGFFGSILGLIGQNLRLSAGFATTMIVVVSVIMAILALQMLGIRPAQRFQLALPKSLTHRISNSDQKVGRFTPFIIGGATFFLPCGFTIIAQGLAVLSGSALRGGLIMGAFALGTFIPLMVIGISSSKLLANERWSEGFQKTAGLLILFFVFFNLNNQFNFGRLFAFAVPTTQITDNGQTSSSSTAKVIKIVYTTAGDIQPSTFEIKRGQPVRFEVEVKDDGYGCMSTIMIPKLYNTPQYLQKGKVLIMEFTPDQTGTYQITCAMGVPRGIIKVVD